MNPAFTKSLKTPTALIVAAIGVGTRLADLFRSAACSACPAAARAGTKTPSEKERRSCEGIEGA